MQKSLTSNLSERTSNIRLYVILIIILTALAVVIWGTLGLRTTATNEDWIFYNAFSQGLSPLDFSVYAQPSRPFLEVASWLGYALTPETFVGLNIVNIGCFFLQGIVVFTIIRRLRPGVPYFALAVAVLSLILPADTTLADNRFVSYHLCIVAFLLSVYFLLDYWQHRHLLSLIGMCVAQVVSLGIVEVAYPLIIVTPILLIWLQSQKRITRRVRRVSGAWYLAPGIMLFYSLRLIFLSSTYQGYMMKFSKLIPLPQHLLEYATYLIQAYWRIFIQSWLEALRHIDFQSGRLLMATLIIILCAFGFWAMNRLTAKTEISDLASIEKVQTNKSAPVMIENNSTWLVIGLLIIGLGFVIYAWLPTHRDQTQRVYLLSSLGGAIAIPVLIAWLGRALKRELLITILGSALLIGIALQGDLVSVLRVRTVSEQEQGLLAQIVQQVPDPSRVKLFLIMEDSHQLLASEIFDIFHSFQHIDPALQYTYHNSNLKIWVCNLEQTIDEPPTPICVITGDGIIMTSNVETAYYAVSDTVAFTYEGEDQLKLLTTWPVSGVNTYNPVALINSDKPVSPRVYNVFSRWPFQLQLPLNEHPSQTVNFDKSDVVWLLDNPAFPLVNYGWYANWTSSTRSTIMTWLAFKHDYQLQITLGKETPAGIKQNIMLSVNGRPVTLSAQVGTDNLLKLTGIIPQDVVELNANQTQLTFNSFPLTVPTEAHSLIDQHLLGFALDQLTIKPIS